MALASHQWCNSTACDAGARLCFTAGGHWRCMRQPIGYLVILHNLCLVPPSASSHGPEHNPFWWLRCLPAAAPADARFCDTFSALDVQHPPAQSRCVVHTARRQHALGLLRAGCTHFIIGRDMAGCKSSISGEDFYGPYQAQDTAKAHAAELGVQTVPSLNITYTEARPACPHAAWYPTFLKL